MRNGNGVGTFFHKEGRSVMQFLGEIFLPEIFHK
jgi:hypothetical protein